MGQYFALISTPPGFPIRLLAKVVMIGSTMSPRFWRTVSV